jgi:hypothetical protein
LHRQTRSWIMVRKSNINPAFVMDKKNMIKKFFSYVGGING